MRFGASRLGHLGGSLERAARGAWLLPLIFIGCDSPADDAVESRASAVVAPAVLTQHNDPSRTGANLNETLLTPSFVSSPLASFGLIYTGAVMGGITTQPLYAP